MWASRPCPRKVFELLLQRLEGHWPPRLCIRGFSQLWRRNSGAFSNVMGLDAHPHVQAIYVQSRYFRCSASGTFGMREVPGSSDLPLLSAKHVRAPKWYRDRTSHAIEARNTFTPGRCSTIKNQRISLDG
jgi:hypothetical protein